MGVGTLRLVGAFACLIALTGCVGLEIPNAPTTVLPTFPDPSSPDPSSPVPSEPVEEPSSPVEKLIVPPPTAGVFDYQLGGDYDAVKIAGKPKVIDVVARDFTSYPLDGAYNICYINGFQTQPQDSKMWLEHPELLLKNSSGKLVKDPDWPDEYILNPAPKGNIEEILAIIGPMIEDCAAKAFDAVEIDNLDTFTRFGSITKKSAIALVNEYAKLAHSLGLAIGQKNAAEYSAELREKVGFDFAVAESCAVWNECGEYTKAYGKSVLHIEYKDELKDAGITFKKACSLKTRGSLMILRDLDLVPAGSKGYVYETCSGS